MEEDDKGCPMIRMGVSGWMFLLVPAYPGSPGQKAVKRLCVCVQNFFWSGIFTFTHRHKLSLEFYFWFLSSHSSNRPEALFRVISPSMCARVQMSCLAGRGILSPAGAYCWLLVDFCLLSMSANEQQMESRLRRRRNWSRSCSLLSAASHLRIQYCNITTPVLRQWLLIETLLKRSVTSLVCSFCYSNINITTALVTRFV